LGRAPTTNAFAADVATRRFDPNGAPDPSAFAGADAVIHLAGESVAGRWTPEKKRAIADSRIGGTRTLVASLRALPQPPNVLISASAVGYYGDRGDEPLTETSMPGTGFLADVCAAWEAAALECEALGTRTVCMRTGIALGSGGALKQMLPPFKLGLGGPLGSGRQFVPWIDVRDLAALYCFAVESTSLTGPINAVAPDYATNARLAQAIGAALHRPSLAPAPAFALRAILGEFSQSLLQSQLVIPAAAQDAGFHWEHERLETALAAILRGASEHSYLHTFHATQVVARPLDEVFAFFSDAVNLAALTPPALSFTLRSAPPRVERGSTIAYALRLHGLPIRWKTLIAQWDPPRRFVDVQLRGPYRLWRHVHDFRPVEGGVEVLDRVDYLIPFAPFGEVASRRVAREIRQIFDYRREALARLFPVETSAG
jgi:hypothetical protein